MTQPSPLVSIVIPVHNGGEHLIDSVRSALDQDYPNLEVVVIDNASNDGAVDLLHRLEDPRLQVHRYDELIPAADNWTRAVQAGKGTYTKLLCADDLLEPGCVSRHVQILHEHPTCGMVAGRRRLIREDGSVIKQSWGLDGLSGAVNGSEAIARCLRAGGNIFGEPGAVLFRTSTIRAALPWLHEAGYVVDVDLFVRVLTSTDLWADQSVVAAFRVSTGQWSARVAGAQSQDFSWLISKTRREHPEILSTVDAARGHALCRIRRVLRSALYARETYSKRRHRTAG